MSFARDGYLVLPGWHPAEELRAWADELESWPDTPGRWMRYYEPESGLLGRAENFVPYHAGLRELCLGRLRAVVSELLGEPAVLFKDKLNFKLPGGEGFEPHQDVQAGWDRWGTLHVTAMLAVDACDEENGRLEIAPGRHRQGLLGRMHEPLSESELAGCSFVGLDCRPGDAVFFDSYAPHRSGPNRSARPRRVLYLTYGRAAEGDHRERYFAEKRKSFPPDCEREAGKTYRYRV